MERMTLIQELRVVPGFWGKADAFAHRFPLKYAKRTARWICDRNERKIQEEFV